MQQRTFLKRLVKGTLLFFVITFLFYWVIQDDWRSTSATLSSVSRGDILTVPAGSSVTQAVTPHMDRLLSVDLDMHPMQADATGAVTVTFTQANTQLASTELSFADLNPDGSTQVLLPTPVVLNDQALLIVISADQDLLLWRGNSQNTGRIDIPVENLGDLTMDGQAVSGNLVFSLEGENELNGTKLYWPIIGAIGLILLAVSLYVHRCSVHGRNSFILRMLRTASKYEYLLKTLVSRDFKIKYRSSLLGVVWSGLHPLMMMGLYYVVFSTIFRSSIQNFPVYLITGIVIYNYFGDSTTLGMQAIVGNAGLINKVYLPKYIYPLSKTISSALNLVISLVVLLLVMLITGAPFSKALLLVPVFLILLVLFCSGIAMCLSTWIVFFRDVQFLWSVCLTAWNFFTPIFYTESILPTGWWTFFFHANPLYQFITAIRRITLEGLAPLPSSLIYCLLWAIFSMVLGMLVFKKHQDQFVLHL